MSLVDSLIKEGWLRTPVIIDAFREVKRVDFLSSSLVSSVRELNLLAEENEAFSIGQGQTISQPLVVAFMLELLQPQPGQNILDIGSGSGWTTALLAQIVSRGQNKGRVTGMETIPELAEFGRKNVAKYGFIEKGIARVVCTDGFSGWPAGAPYDRILASASLKEGFPDAWKKQLKVGGRIVSPVKNSIWLGVKKRENEFELNEYPGFVFVPLVSKKQ